MNHQKVKKFSIIGISVRTTNENGKAAQDIPALWNQFMLDETIQKIPNKIDDTIYCIYTDYEKDHTKPYTTIIGCKVENLDTIPEGMVGKFFNEALYAKQTAKGNIIQGLVYNEWVQIWNLNLNRTFTADFEVYGEKAQDLENAEVDIFVAIQ
jgi:predicted transcriptional regulator YdeE